MFPLPKSLSLLVQESDVVIKSEFDLLRALGITKEEFGEGPQLGDIKRLVATRDGSHEKNEWSSSNAALDTSPNAEVKSGVPFLTTVDIN